MAPLTSEQIRKENQNRDSSSVTSLSLTLRAVSDVSCLREFSNLERLNLSCNNLSSLQELSPCANLKWLSVAQNKLESLKGIEGLLKLTVLNAGQNMIKSMNEVRSLTCLRALILNDNNISSICSIDLLMHLNTLVLSRNPIYKIGKSLEKTKSITKLSLSNCHIQDIGNSLSFCLELKEARFAHNEILTLPNQLSQNSRLQLLDLGKNAISKLSDLKVISTLSNLKNLNLQGNPIAENSEKRKLAKKVKKLVPSLQIFNAKPIEKSLESRKINEKDSSFSSKGVHHSRDSDLEVENEINKNRFKMDAKASKRKPSDDHESDVLSVEVMHNVRKKVKTTESAKQMIVSSAINDNKSPFDSIDIKARKEAKKQKTKTSEGNRIKEFDDGKSSFMDLVIPDDISEDDPKKKGIQSKMASHENKLSGLVINTGKKKKKKTRAVATGSAALKLLPSAFDVGMGGPSAWN